MVLLLKRLGAVVNKEKSFDFTAIEKNEAMREQDSMDLEEN